MATGKTIVVLGKEYAVKKGPKGGYYYEKGSGKKKEKRYLSFTQKQDLNLKQDKSGKRSPIKKKSPVKKKRGCPLQATKKYRERMSPAYPANECCDQIKFGKDGLEYISKADKNGVCRWTKVKK